MKSRMDKYQSEANIQRSNRTVKNQDLYNDFSINSRFPDAVDINEKNVYELNMDQTGAKTSREHYHKVKEFQSILPNVPEKRELERYNRVFDEETKSYDINNVLVEAKKNREDLDEYERKRKLRNTQYNILANLDLKDIKRDPERRELARIKEDIDEGELNELINTITTKNITRELLHTSTNLLEDLLPTQSYDAVAKPKEEEEEDTLNLDNSFYTRSMDLSEKDFDMSDEFTEPSHKKGRPLIKGLLFFFLILVVSFIIYFIITKFNQ